MAQPILIAWIYVIEGNKKAMQNKIKNQFRWLEGDNKNYCNLLIVFQKWITS